MRCIFTILVWWYLLKILSESFEPLLQAIRINAVRCFLKFDLLLYFKLIIKFWWFCVTVFDRFQGYNPQTFCFSVVAPGTTELVCVDVSELVCVDVSVLTLGMCEWSWAWSWEWWWWWWWSCPASMWSWPAHLLSLAVLNGKPRFSFSSCCWRRYCSHLNHAAVGV